jgi:hypothetical protein
MVLSKLSLCALKVPLQVAGASFTPALILARKPFEGCSYGVCARACASAGSLLCSLFRVQTCHVCDRLPPVLEDALECWRRYRQQNNSLLTRAYSALTMWSILRTASYAKFVKSEVSIPCPVQNRAGREVDLSGLSLEVRSLSRRTLFGVIPLPA